MGCGDEHHETDQTNQRIEDDKSREKNKRGTSGQIIYLSFDRLSDFLHSVRILTFTLLLFYQHTCMHTPIINYSFGPLENKLRNVLLFMTPPSRLAYDDGRYNSSNLGLLNHYLNTSYDCSVCNGWGSLNTLTDPLTRE